MILLTVIAIMYVALFLSILRTQKQTPLGVFDYEFAIRYVDSSFHTDFKRYQLITNNFCYHLFLFIALIWNHFGSLEYFDAFDTF